MADAINHPVGAVVGQQYCAPYPVDLAIVRKVLTLQNGKFEVTDVNENLLFKVKEKCWSLRNKMVIHDTAGNPILTLRRKLWSAHSRWQVFRGESSDPNDLIFTAKTSSIFQFNTKLNVYLSNNTSEQLCDFKVKGSWLQRSCAIYAGESDDSDIVAQMHKKLTAQSFFLGKDKFMVTVQPNIDHAFIVALIVILDAINSAASANSGGGG